MIISVNFQWVIDKIGSAESTSEWDGLVVHIMSAKSMYWTADELVGKCIQTALFEMALSFTNSIHLTHNYQL